MLPRGARRWTGDGQQGEQTGDGASVPVRLDRLLGGRSLQSGDGNYYATSAGTCGPNNQDSCDYVLRIDPAGAVTTLYTFQLITAILCGLEREEHAMRCD